MDVHYFAETDSMIIRLSQRQSAETRELADDLLVDFDADGHLISIEILAGASQVADISSLSAQGFFGTPWDARKIKHLRTLMGLTQESFAQEIGTTRLQVTRWENGGAAPNRMAQRLLSLLSEKVDGKAMAAA